MNKEKLFLVSERLKSFKYAFDGIAAFLKEEHNARIHLAATILVIVLSGILPVSLIEMMVLTIVIGLVWITEIINTAIEKSIDFISIEENKKIKFIKDVSAAAVLLASVVAVIVGCLVFIPKF